MSVQVAKSLYAKLRENRHSRELRIFNVSRDQLKDLGFADRLMSMSMARYGVCSVTAWPDKAKRSGPLLPVYQRFGISETKKHSIRAIGA